jgi:hypothetical protein
MVCVSAWDEKYGISVLLKYGLRLFLQIYRVFSLGLLKGSNVLLPPPKIRTSDELLSKDYGKCCLDKVGQIGHCLRYM